MKIREKNIEVGAAQEIPPVWLPEKKPEPPSHFAPQQASLFLRLKRL